MGLLRGKVVLVTGGGGGIGRSHALACAREGAAIVVNDLGCATDGTAVDDQPADKVVREIIAAGGRAVADHGSVSNAGHAQAMVDRAIEVFGRLDAVINNAGILRDRTFAKLSAADWDAVIDVHLTGTRNVTAAALPALKVRGGSLVNTTSTSGLLGNFGQANYGAAKAGIYGLSRVLALELARSGITVNCLAPFATTRMTEGIPQVDASWGPEAVAAVAVYLLSDLARGVTGRVFGIQGQRLFAYEMIETPGACQAPEVPWTALDIHRSFAEIVARPTTALPPVGRFYDGGTVTVDAAEARAYAAATDDGNAAYQGSDAIAPPMFHVKLMMPLMMAFARDPELNLDMLRLVHGEHAMTFHQPLRPGQRVALSASLQSLVEKASGRVATFGLYGHVDGELALSGTTTYFIRGDKKPAGKDKAADKAPAKPAPTPPVQTVVEQRVTSDQAVRYAEASGDRNPIHLDAAVAQKAGLPGVILHGLCTMAFAQRDFVDLVCDGDPSRLRHLSVRFAKPVFAGQTLRMAIGAANNGAYDFRTLNEAGENVIVNGRAVVDPV